MTIAYTWQFDFLDVFPTYQTVTDVVKAALAAQIAAQQNPVTATGTPWGTTV